MSTNDASPNTRSSKRDALEVWGIALLLATIGTLVALHYVGAAPPHKVVLATGPTGGAYHEIATALRRAIPESELEIELRATRGSVENHELLEAGEVDLAIVQGGILDRDVDTEIEAIGGVGIEPVWIFARRALRRLDELRGQKIAVGPEGSGSRPVALELLELAGFSGEDFTTLELAPSEASDALISGACDALVLVAGARAETVDRLMRASGIHLASLSRAHAFTRHAHYLRDVRLTPGMFDIDDELPETAVDMLATTATLVTRSGFHDGLPPLLLDAARRTLHEGGLFADEGDFPSAKDLDVPLAAAASAWFENGRSWLYRVLPFRFAALVDRLKILLLPLLTLLVPLIRFAPPVYRWRVRRRIFRWYAVVLDIEGDVREGATEESVEHAIERVEALQREITGIRVPLGYAEELYNLRMHLRQVREDLGRHLASFGAQTSA